MHNQETCDLWDHSHEGSLEDRVERLEHLADAIIDTIKYHAETPCVGCKKEQASEENIVGDYWFKVEKAETGYVITGGYTTLDLQLGGKIISQGKDANEVFSMAADAFLTGLDIPTKPQEASEERFREGLRYCVNGHAHIVRVRGGEIIESKSCGEYLQKKAAESAEQCKPQEEPKEYGIPPQDGDGQCCTRGILPGNKRCPIHYQKESESKCESKECIGYKNGYADGAMIEKEQNALNNSVAIILPRPKGMSIEESIHTFYEWMKKEDKWPTYNDQDFLKLWQEWLKTITH